MWTQISMKNSKQNMNFFADIAFPGADQIAWTADDAMDLIALGEVSQLDRSPPCM